MRTMERVEKAMQGAVAEGTFPGAVLLVGLERELVFLAAYGDRQLLPARAPMARDTLFDVASMTKALATTSALMLLVQRGILSLEGRAAESLPEMGEAKAPEMTLRHLLSHSTGLPPWKPYYREVAPSLRREVTQERFVKRIAQEERLFAPGSGTLYSDLDFLLLGAIVERTTGKALDIFCREEIFRPLGLKTIGFLPLASRHRGAPSESALTEERGSLNIAATEDCPWRKRVLCGEVHDENAYALGGVAGHAGLFAAAEEIYSLAGMLLDAYHGRGDLFQLKTVRRFFTRQPVVPGSTWALGWDTPSPKGSSAGRYFSANSVGHLGYTGTSLWMDLDRSLVVVLLTNRVHPSRDNDKLKAFRPLVHDLIVEELRAWNGT